MLEVQQAATEAGAGLCTVARLIQTLWPWLDVIAKISDSGVAGTLQRAAAVLLYIEETHWRLALASSRQEIFVSGEVPTIFGTPYIVVPNLMPSISTEEFVKHEPSTGKLQLLVQHSTRWLERVHRLYTSGGLQYTMSSKHLTDSTSKSAYERNELVVHWFVLPRWCSTISRVAGIKEWPIFSIERLNTTRIIN